MKINDFIFRFRTNTTVCSAGICRVRTFINSKSDIYVLLSELDENPSESVTNAIEIIVAQLQEQQKIPLNAKIIEHYPKQDFFPETFDFISFSPDGNPSWVTVSYTTILQAMECPNGEFDNYKEDQRVQAEIQTALLGFPKIEQFEYVEPPAITERRLEIESRMHSLKKVKESLNSYPSEAELATFLKRDMSLFAELYANPKDEYICFAEFPVGNGRVDFALFTGRSRMDVYLIEIKGAKENLRRKNYYGEFRADVQEGRGQLIERKNWCEHHYADFQESVHRILNDVIEGKRPYHAFPGPKHRLSVDPEKDIKLHYILIAGRTSDNLRDSQKRHEEDSAMGFHLQTETWDSWINKLSRK